MTERKPKRLPVEEWMQVPVSDSADYLDRPDPIYIKEPSGAPFRLPSRDQLEKSAKDFVETTRFVDPATGEPYAPTTVPEVFDPEGDEDAESAEPPQRVRELVPPDQTQRLDGSESLGPGTVNDFWRWALGDLRMNNARGYLAEYLVAKAVGDNSPIRIEWGPYDARAADGTLIEIKASGYLQSWRVRPSTPSYAFPSVAASQVWSADLGRYVPVEPAERVHVWVFALQACQEPDVYDPLDTAQWEFRVVPHRQLLATGQTSARLSFFDRLEPQVERVSYSQLADAVAAARKQNDSLRDGVDLGPPLS